VIELGEDQNHAMIGNAILARDDGESVPDFRARSRSAALDLGADTLVFALLEPVVWVEDVEQVEISGGLTDGVADIATISAGSNHLIRGGLPAMQVGD
jgi:hypothetical protein